MDYTDIVKIRFLEDWGDYKAGDVVDENYFRISALLGAGLERRLAEAHIIDYIYSEQPQKLANKPKVERWIIDIRKIKEDDYGNEFIDKKCKNSRYITRLYR